MLRSWLGGSHPASTQSLSAADEPEALQLALRAMDMLMDDDVSGAEKALKNGNSSFHKLATGVVAFLRASLGFEADIMKEASERLADAEAAAERDRKRAVKEGLGHKSLPAGIEFSLCSAEAQLMSAVVGVLSESMVESMKAFLKLRTAYKILENLHNILDASDLQKFGDGPSSSKVTLSEESAAQQTKQFFGNNSSEEEDQLYETADMPSAVELPKTDRTTSFASENDGQDLATFCASGTQVCFGLLLLMLSMAPPSLAKVLQVVGYRGDRELGLSLLWKASAANNVHGAIASLVVLQYYGQATQFCDILPREEGTASNVGYPRRRCHDALHRMKKRYPHSALWILESARMESLNSNLDGAVEMLSAPVTTQMRQVEALMLFEKSLNCMYLHRYEEVAEGFLKLTTLSNWSHALYYYFAATCYIELYRHSEKGSDVADKHAERAEELLKKIPSFMGKRRFMAQSLPLEVFADRKIKKWTANSVKRGVRLVDGVSVSPYEEMIYLWNGYKRMNTDGYQVSLHALEYEGDSESEGADDKAIRWLVLSVVNRNISDENLAQAKELLEKITALDKAALSGRYHDEWITPSAYYEMAVVLWAEFGPEGREETRKWLVKASTYGPFELDARLGIRVQTAMGTIEKC